VPLELPEARSVPVIVQTEVQVESLHPWVVRRQTCVSLTREIFDPIRTYSGPWRPTARPIGPGRRFVSPISRYSIVAGKIIGESLVALPQALAVLALALLLGISVSPLTLVVLLPTVLAMAIYGGAFGILVLSNISSQRTANQIFPFVMLPQFFLAGVFNPIHDLPPVLAVLSALSPMRWAVEAVRHVYYATQPGAVPPELSPATLVAAVIAISFVGFIAVGTALFVRAERNR
jgi:ABC-2 type transport system permease protein